MSREFEDRIMPAAIERRASMVRVPMDTARGKRAALQRMILIRTFENRTKEAYRDGELPGFIHLYTGQEAVAVGAIGALDERDYVTSTHRAHGHVIAEGLDIGRFLAEIYGRKDGYSGAKGGEMHVAAPETGFLGGNGIVGAGVPIAAGAALATDLSGDDDVTMAILGDGAIPQGAVHEGINLAATRGLPIVFLLENNQYAQQTGLDTHHPRRDALSDFASAYSLPGETIDGQDVELVWETVREAHERAARGDGPSILEAETYRFEGHFEGDSEPYRDREEVESWKRSRDPITIYRRRLEQEIGLTDEAVKEMRTTATEAVEEAVSFARSSPKPEPSSSYGSVYADPVPEIDAFRDRRAGRSPTWPRGTGDTPREDPELTYREAIRHALREELDRDDETFVLGVDISVGSSFDVTKGLVEEFGADRVVDTPLAEGGVVGAALGLALVGKRPIAELMFADFLGVAGDQVINQVSKIRYMLDGATTVPLTVRMPEGAGLNASAQHSQTLHTWLGNLPGVKVVLPSTPAAAKGLTKAAIRSDDPVFVFESKPLYKTTGPVPKEESFTLPLGRAAIERPGDDVTLVATQRLLHDGLAVAEDLAGEISVEVIDPRSLYPLDTATIGGSVSKTGRLVIADESPLSYGSHGEIGMRAMEESFYSLKAKIQRVGVPDVSIPFAPTLEDEVLPGKAEIRNAIERTIV